MADITKCNGINCPLKESCYRFKAKANEYLQSYFQQDPYNKDAKDCAFYWSLN